MQARRQLVAAALGTALLALAAPAAAADPAWPTKPVRILFGFPAASATDVIARAVGQKLSEKWGQPVVIENRPGAGGNLGTELAARAPGDGYTIFFGTVANAISTTLYTKLNYDYLKDFKPITLVSITPLVLVANPSVPFRNVKELIAHARANPGKLNFGSGGVGTSNHLAGEMFKRATDTDLVHVAYKGTPAAYNDMFSGQIALMFDNIVAATPHVKSERLRPIAVSSKERVETLPDVPTLAESGLPGFEAVSWIGALVPAATPEPIADKIHTDMVAVLRDPDLRRQLASAGAIVVGNSRQEFARWNEAEIAKWAQAVKQSGAKLD
ncbi:MAG: tripartite tricarboxylate transporter substrate binding protein [Rhodocyclaceae bacterium]|nr:tripartite tricarboxylate transporter substrate binding protein [Pseudomonadota bacterium]MDQ7974052.1 tripartite tricarboxylate transporter substrate binding protein [Rhodocyclaceae bacterium]MDQ8002728.1 tripartite tricarboxylate transporter substrate binding protein [Pseudomonadota bacterium]MDQ8015356.1 tripartite tricarboxylate transporter substrate binding protein [Pseudomonadota bacterium]